jgi:hypothetical protein
MAAVHVTKQAHLAWCRIDQVMLASLAHRESVADQDVEEFIEYVNNDFREHGVVDGFFTYSPTATLSITQRKMLTDATERLGQKRFRVNAFVTDSRLMRGAATALGWFARDVKIKAFRLSEVPQALAWLKEQGCRFDLVEAQRAFDQMVDRITRTGDSGGGPSASAVTK